MPVPVGAVTNKFLSYNKAGIVCICTGVGFLKPISANPSNNLPSIWYFLANTPKYLLTNGTSVP